MLEIVSDWLVKEVGALTIMVCWYNCWRSKCYCSNFC